MSILVMPRWVAVFIGLTFAFATGVAQAREATPDVPSTGEDERAVQAVVGAQLKAFRDGDLAMAFSFADQTIQAMVGGPRQFGVMVARGYGPIYANESHRFLQSQVQGIQAVQLVLVRGRDGTVALAQYQLSKASGQWRIRGVSMQLMPPTTEL